MNSLKKLDKVIFAGMLILSLLSILFTNVIFSSAAAEFVIVEVGGREYGKYPLKETEKILEINSEYGYNKIEIKDGKVKITEADCGDLLCVKAGEIDRSGSMLCCLPSRLLIRIAGKSGVDTVAY